MFKTKMTTTITLLLDIESDFCITRQGTKLKSTFAICVCLLMFPPRRWPSIVRHVGQPCRVMIMYKSACQRKTTLSDSDHFTSSRELPLLCLRILRRFVILSMQPVANKDQGSCRSMGHVGLALRLLSPMVPH